MRRGCTAGVIIATLLLTVGSADAFDPLQRARRAAAASLHSLAEGDTARAIEQMLRAQTLAPEDPEIRHALGEVFYRGGEYDSAQRQFESLLVDPEAVDDRETLQPASTLYNAANAAFRRQDYQQALELYTRALLELPEPTQPGEDLLYNLELSQKLLEEAESSPEQSGEGDPDPEQEQEPSDDASSQSPPEGEPRSQEQDPSQSQEPEDPQQPEAGPDSTQSQEQPDSMQTQPTPPDSLAKAEPESLQTLPEGMTAAEALRLLEALDHEEEELRRSIQRRLRGGETESERDW